MVYQSNAGIPSTCPKHCSFLDLDNCYKRIAKQILQDIGLALIRTAGNRTCDRYVRGSISASAPQRLK